MAVPTLPTSSVAAAAPDLSSDPAAEPPPELPMGILRIVALSLYLLGLAGVSVYVMYRVWPLDPPVPVTVQERDTAAAASSSSPAARSIGDTVTVFGLTLDFRPPHSDRRLLLIALLAGGLGAFVSSAFSMARFMGKGKLTRPWTLYYILRPPSGMLLALVVYFGLRGGLLQPTAGADAVSPYGVAAFSGLIGMFVRQATDKLRHIAETMFSAPPPKEDGAEPETEAAGERPATPKAVAAAHHPDPGA